MKSKIIAAVSLLIMALLFGALSSCNEQEHHCMIVGGCNQDSVKVNTQDVEIEQIKFGVYFHSQRIFNRDEYIRELNHQYRDITFFDAGGQVRPTSLDIDDVSELQDYSSFDFIKTSGGSRVINVYFFNQSKNGLLGFVYMPVSQFHVIKSSPRYWQVFATKEHRPIQTVVHEIGHLMSLPHRFEDHCNVMSYGNCGYELNFEQRQQAAKFALKYR